MNRVSVIGAGTMGNGIAHLFAQNGFDVNLIDVSSDQLNTAIATITKNLDRQVAKGLLTPEAKDAALKKITTHTSLAEGVKFAELVVEAARLSIVNDGAWVDISYGAHPRVKPRA